MHHHTTSRLGAASGLVAVIGLMALNSTASQSTAVRGGELVALMLFVPFLAYLCSVLRDGDGPGWLLITALASGLVAVTIKVASVIPEITVRHGDHGAALNDALEQLAEVSFIVSLLPLGLCLGAVAAIVLRTRVLPVWLGWMAALTAPLLVLNSFDHGSEFGPAFVLFLLWALCTSVVLLRRATTATAPGVMSPRRAVTS